MLGELNDTQINNLLSSQAIGRLACCRSNRPYIVPVTYAFDGKDIICQSNPGTKIEMMRKNPFVCFQVDMILNMANWQSVVVRGSFHELKGKAAERASTYLHERVFPLMTSSTIHAHEHAVNTAVDDSNRLKPILYRIRIAEKTGRYEKQ